MLSHYLEPEILSFNSIRHNHRADPAFLPLHLTGGVGDVVMSIEAVRWFSHRHNIIVYTHHLEAFRHFVTTDEIPSFKEMPDFTWNIEFNTLIKFRLHEGFHGFKEKEHELLFEQQQTVFRREPRIQSMVETYWDRSFFLISNYAKEMNLTRRQMPMHTIGVEFSDERVIDNTSTEKIITIHDGFDLAHQSIVHGRATKQWSWKHWCELVKDIKRKYPAYKIVQLGATATSRAIDGVDQCLLGKTTITEAFDWLSISRLHIDGDSGLAHAATKLGTKCIVMWGPTPEHFYGYRNNINLRVKERCPGSCYGLKKNWNDKCPIGYPTPVCMDDITPQSVMEGITYVLG